MTKVVFPTKEKLSYISPLDTFEDSKYLTVLSCRGQNIDSVDIIRNPYAIEKKGFSKYCSKKHFDVLIGSDVDSLPLKKLDKKHISVFKSEGNKIILNIFSDFVQDKLKRVK